MRFGAAPADDGGVRFRLWAPQAGAATLRIEDRPEPVELEMAPEADGWFGLVTSLAAPGSRYRFRLGDAGPFPDPASRFQPADVHGPSEVIDPHDYDWSDDEWPGRPWTEAVIYELHVGSFTPRGTYAGVAERLDHLAALGVTAIELMPVADFAGGRNWGYDGVLPFAPDSAYGRPEDLKALVDAAHRRGLMVLLDVVYNHFGPEGNYLPRIAPAFFSERHHTRWGAGINYDGPGSATVRSFVIDNALYWLTEYHLDGLRLDAVDTIADDSHPDILEELADHVHRTVDSDRHVHLVLENDRNEARYLERDDRARARAYSAQWNDDFHHAAHVLVSGEHDGYYRDYADAPASRLGRCLAEGFGYQGEPSEWREGRRRGSPSAHLPPTAFVDFLQNHDQVGNRPFGERMTALAPPEAVAAATAVLLLAPQPPLLFMGQEWASERPFLFFCDFEPGLAARVRNGRREEFAGFAAFREAAARERIPDPGDPDTFARCVLDWDEPASGVHAAWLAFHRELLALRGREIVPRLAGDGTRARHWTVLGDERTLDVEWQLADGSRLRLWTNLGPEPVAMAAEPPGRSLYRYPPRPGVETELPPWSAHWFLQPAPAGT